MHGALVACILPSNGFRFFRDVPSPMILVMALWGWTSKWRGEGYWDSTARLNEGRSAHHDMRVIDRYTMQAYPMRLRSQFHWTAYCGCRCSGEFEDQSARTWMTGCTVRY